MSQSLKELVFRICLFIAGMINFIPSLLAVFPENIASSYGIDLLNPNYELLLRHRAVLFGIVGGVMIYSAFSKKHFNLAVAIGMVSMISFLILTKLVSGEIGPELTKVMTIDIVGIVVLTLGYAIYLSKRTT